MYLSISNFDQFCFMAGKSYYPQLCLEECIYVVKEKVYLGILLAT